MSRASTTLLVWVTVASLAAGEACIRIVCDANLPAQATVDQGARQNHSDDDSPFGPVRVLNDQAPALPLFHRSDSQWAGSFLAGGKAPTAASVRHALCLPWHEARWRSSYSATYRCCALLPQLHLRI